MALRDRSHSETCTFCHKISDVIVTYGPGGGWDEECTYHCAHCGKPMGARKAFAVKTEKPAQLD